MFAPDWEDSLELRYSIELAAGRRLRFRRPFRAEQEHRVELSRGHTDFLTPLFYLSLYSDRFFVVRDLLLCERGWQCYRIRLEDDHETTDPACYEISEVEFERFRTFVRVCNKVAGLDERWMPLEVAKRHFMAATFAPRDPFYAWGTSFYDDPPYPATRFLGEERHSRYHEEDGIFIYEGLLLHYLISLEALFANSLERKLKREIRLARIIHLVGRTEEERKWIGELLGKAYDLRNLLVHRSDPPKLILDLRKLRRICQRACCVVVGLLESKRPAGKVSDLLRTLDTQISSRNQVSAIREKMYRLVQDSSPLGGKFYISD
jgi:hypothetical protein